MGLDSLIDEVGLHPSRRAMQVKGAYHPAEYDLLFSSYESAHRYTVQGSYDVSIEPGVDFGFEDLILEAVSIPESAFLRPSYLRVMVPFRLDAYREYFGSVRMAAEIGTIMRTELPGGIRGLHNDIQTVCGSELSLARYLQGGFYPYTVLQRIFESWPRALKQLGLVPSTSEYDASTKDLVFDIALAMKESPTVTLGPDATPNFTADDFRSECLHRFRDMSHVSSSFETLTEKARGQLPS